MANTVTIYNCLRITSTMTCDNFYFLHEDISKLHEIKKQFFENLSNDNFYESLIRKIDDLIYFDDCASDVIISELYNTDLRLILDVEANKAYVFSKLISIKERF